MKSEHLALLDAALAGDADTAVELLHAHFERTAKIILQDRTLFQSGSGSTRSSV